MIPNLLASLLNQNNPAAPAAPTPPAPPTVTGAGTQTKTVSTIMQQGKDQPYSQQDVIATGQAAMAANRKHEGVANSTMMKSQAVHEESEGYRAQFKAAQKDTLAATQDKGTLMMRETADRVDANQQAYKEFNATIGSDEFSTGRTMMMQQYAERQQDLAKAHQDLQNGGFIDSIGAAFRVAYHQQRLEEIGASVQQTQAVEFQAGQQLLMNLQKNAAAVGDVYAIEKQQNLNKAEVAATLQKMSADGAQLNKDSMAEMASLLGISSEVANAKLKDFNIIIASNNASSSIFQTKLQELQMEQAKLNLDRTKTAFNDEKAMDAAMESRWAKWSDLMGIKNPTTFKEATAIAERTKQPSPELVQFGLYLGKNRDSLSVSEAYLKRKGNAPLTTADEAALSRGNIAKAALDREIFAENEKAALAAYPTPLNAKGEVDQAAEMQIYKKRNEYLAQLNAQKAINFDNPTDLGKVEQKAKELDAIYQQDKNRAYADGVIQDSPVEEVNTLAKTPGPARELLKTKLSPEVFAMLEKGEFDELSTTVSVGKPPAQDTFQKLNYAVKSAAEKSGFNIIGADKSETVSQLKARIKQQAEVVAAGWKVKVQASPDYKNQNFNTATMMLPVPAADGSAGSDMIEIDMTNPSAVYYYMEQLSKKPITDHLASGGLRLTTRDK